MGTFVTAFFYCWQSKHSHVSPHQMEIASQSLGVDFSKFYLVLFPLADPIVCPFAIISFNH